MSGAAGGGRWGAEARGEEPGRGCEARRGEVTRDRDQTRRPLDGGRRVVFGAADDEHMRVALEEARRAGVRGEIPVGAVVVVEGRVVARAGNASVRPHDPTGHAEIRALRRAARRLGSYRLPNATLVVTLEPCLMCMGAMVHARIGRLVFGAHDPKAGAAVSLYRVAEDRRLNHRFPATGGVAAEACAALLRHFFAERRAAPRLR